MGHVSISFYFVYIFFYAIHYLLMRVTKTHLIQTILSLKFYPNQHHLYTFLDIRKHNLLKFTSAIQSIQNIQDSKNDCTFIYSRQLLVFYFCYSEYRKTNKRFICISRFLTKEAFHCISLHLSVENDKFRYLGTLLN